MIRYAALMMSGLVAASAWPAAPCGHEKQTRTGAAPSRVIRENEGMRAATEDVERLLNDFHDAASKADFDGYFGHQTPDAVFLGTDGTERWVGQAFRDFCKPYFDQGKGWTYHPRDRHVRIADACGVAWFDEMLDNESYGPCRGSGVAVRGEDGAWRIAQYNLSIPIPNDLAKPVVKMIRDHAAQQPPPR